MNKRHYFEGYDTKKRFINYWHQIEEVKLTDPENVLEIGPGNKLVTDYLRKRGYDVTTVDVNPDLEPDFVESVDSLTETFEPNSFDTVLSAEVLEHLPFDKFEKSLEELRKVSKNYVVLSLPHPGIDFRFSVKALIVGEKSFCLKIPPFLSSLDKDSEHCWEIGRQGKNLSAIKDIISNFFSIEKTYFDDLDPYRRFFVLKTMEGPSE